MNDEVKYYKQVKKEMLIRMVEFLKGEGVIPINTKCLIKVSEE